MFPYPMPGLLTPDHPRCLALHAIALLGFSSLALTVLATPIPLPSPLVAPDYSLRLASANRSAVIGPRQILSLPVVPAVPSQKSRKLGSPNSDRSIDPVEQLAQYSSTATRSAGTLNNLANNSGNVDNDDTNFQQEFVSGLSNFNANMQDVHEFLATSASDKGLANYDKQNDVEKLLKELVNANKDTLSAIYISVNNIPGLGPMLGPLVYNLKCLIDALLDQTEDISDALVNALGPALQELLGSPTLQCHMGAILVGLCV